MPRKRKEVPKKTYLVTFTITGTARVEVDASSGDEAIELAENELRRDDIDEWGVSDTHVEEYA